MNISAVMIVKNGEETIAGTLESLKAFDDVVVYDTGSSDNTLNIVQSYENVVLHLASFTGFSDSKNKAALLAKNDWILSVDADEVVSPELLDSLKNLKLKDNTVYKIKRNNYYRNSLIRYSGWGNEHVFRLYNKKQTKFNSKLVHEHIDYKNMSVEKIAGDLRHYSYLSISHFVIKRDLYSTLFAVENRGKRKSSPLIAFLKGSFDFFNTYVLNLAFLDGYRGLLISMSNAGVTFYKYLKLYEANIANDKKICLIIYCNDDCSSVVNTVDSALRQTLPPDEIIICLEKDNELINNEIKDIKKRSFVPVSLFKTSDYENPITCINKIVTSNDKGFFIITYGSNILLSKKFVATHVHKTKPGNYTFINGVRISKQIYDWYSKNKKVCVYSRLSSFVRHSLLKLDDFFNNRIHSYKSAFSVAFYKEDYIANENYCEIRCHLREEMISILENNGIEEKILKNQLLKYNEKSKNKKILICMDRLKFLNCGLGQVSLNFGRELLKNQSEDYDIVFMLPQKGFREFEEKGSYIKLNIFKSVCSRYMKNYDLCHVPHQLPSYSFGQSAKNIITIHDLNFILTKSLYKSSKYLRNVQRNIYKSDAIIFISDFTKEMTYKYLDIPKTKRVEVIYNGVVSPLKSDIRPDWLPDKKVLFSIGQFLDKKNFHVLLPFVKEFSDDYVLVIAGENRTVYGDKLRRMIQELSIQDKVIFPGGISELEKGYLFHHCTAFLFPSIAEGFGLPVIEAMLCSKPVFCSDRTSLREIGNDFAFFWTDFEVNNMISVYKSGMDLIARTRHLEKQKIYAETYTYKKNVEQYVNLYHSLLQELDK